MTMTSPSNMLWDLLQAQPHDEESIMQCLYDHPDCCSLVIDDKLAIHAAIEQCLSMDIIKQMLICYPACCSRKNCSGNMLLHDLLQSEGSHNTSDAILLIIDGYIEAVRVKDFHGYLPLHMECRNQCRYGVITTLLLVYPEAISSICRQDLPFHYALRNMQACSYESIMYLIDAYPDAVRIRDRFDCLPLHTECNSRCRYDVIIKLIDIYRDAISSVDKDGYCYKNYPLHCTALHRALYCKHGSSEVILYLISVYPAAARCTNVDGELPLRMECSYRCRYDVILKLLDVYPEAIKIDSGKMKTPLHIMLLRKDHPPIQVIQLLLDRHPDAIKAGHNGLLSVYHFFNKYYDQYVSPYASYSSKLSMQYKALIVSMINFYPTAVDGAHITAHMIRIHNVPLAYRLLLLLAYDHMQHHDHDMQLHYTRYHDMNKQYRYPLLYLILQLSPSQQLSYDMIHVHHACMIDATLCKVLQYMMSAAGRWMKDRSSDEVHDDGHDIGKDEMTYCWMQGDDLGSMLLRRVVLYL